MGEFDHLPQTLAEKCVAYLPCVPSLRAWAEICMEATIQEGGGPMLEAAKMRMPLGHPPETRQIMVLAAKSRIEALRLLSRL